MKTLFICLYTGAAVSKFIGKGRGLELLIEKVKDNTGLKVVILTGAGFRTSLSSYLVNDRMSIEIIDMYVPKGFIQKAFHFFYAYLMFTGTTEVLATIGARADITPAGGNKHLVHVKRFIAHTFGKSKWVKTRLVPFLYDLVFRQRPYKEIFDRHHPDLVFVSALAFRPDVEVVAEARRQGVQTMGMTPNWDHLNKYYIPVHVDTLLVQNRPMEREAVLYHAYEPEQIKLVGFPQFDIYNVREKYVIPKEEFFKEMGLPIDAKLIVYFSNSAFTLDEGDILEEIAHWIRDGKFKQKVHLLVRPYVSAREITIEEKKYEKLQGNSHITFNWRKSGGEFSDNEDNQRYFISMLHYADVVISLFSTTALEAAIFDKPTLTIGFDGYKKYPPDKSITRLEKLTYFKNVIDTGGVLIMRSFAEMHRKLQEYIDNPKLDSDKRALLVEKLCYKMDGKSSERIVNYIVEGLK